MKRGRLGISIVLIVSLLAAAGLRTAAIGWQVQASSSRADIGTAPGGVGAMSSFALALLLGGLRGPLVMFLWSSSEYQKNEHNLADFDTKVEWIRILQPEFDTVHVFQMWNKAYNISVLMASPANKYISIMQGIAYGENVEKEKPGDINILNAISNIYSNKMGARVTRPEDIFYNRQLREETMTDPSRRIAYPDDKNFTRLWSSTLSLDDSNNIIPSKSTPLHPRPDPTIKEWNDGSALQYLATYQPFPYGIPPAALAYNYAKRAQVALTVEGQRPLQMSGMVVDSRPALEIRGWAEEELKRARAAEAKAFKIEVKDDSSESDSALASIKPDATGYDPFELDSAIHSYGLAARLARDAHAEYERHNGHSEYINPFHTYASHIDEVDQDAYISQADHDYLQAIKLGNAPEALHWRLTAAVNYRKAIIQSQRVVLRYYTEDEVAAAVFPPHMGREQASRLPDEQIPPLFDRLLAVAAKNPNADYNTDRLPFIRDVQRGARRFDLLNPAPK